MRSRHHSSWIAPADLCFLFPLFTSRKLWRDWHHRSIFRAKGQREVIPESVYQGASVSWVDAAEHVWGCEVWPTASGRGTQGEALQRNYSNIWSQSACLCRFTTTAWFTAKCIITQIDWAIKQEKILFGIFLFSWLFMTCVFKNLIK